MMAMLSSSQNARSNWPGVMPRSWQISAMTAPIGRRRISAALSCSVGRRARSGCWVGSAGPGAGGVNGHMGRGGLAARMGAGVRSLPLSPRWNRFGFEGGGAAQAIGDAGEDDGDVGAAERSGEVGGAWGGGVLLDRGGELLAIVDEFAEDAEDAAEGIGHGFAGPGRNGIWGWRGELGGGRHERNKNTTKSRRQGKTS